MPEIIQENAFIHLKGEISKAAAFEKIGQWFFKNGFAEKEFAEKLFEREGLSSTSFSSGIALPHSIRYEGRKTGILIFKPEKPLHWDNQIVQLILSFTISPDDSKDFNKIFPHLIEILTEEYHVEYLRRSENRKEFLERMIELLSV